MAYSNIKRLGASNYIVHATASIAYTAPASGSEVASLWLHNITPATSCGVEVFLPLSSSIGADSASFRRISQTIGAGQSLEISQKVPFVLDGSDMIYMRAQFTGSINAIMYGRDNI
jgi:hypothetical protein